MCRLGLAAASCFQSPIRLGGRPVGVADIHVASSSKRAPLRLIAEVAGAAAMVIALTATVSAQSASNFLNNIDPLFAGVLAHPGNLDNTIQYAASAATQGDIESAISTYEQLRFYNPKLGATRYQLGVLYYQLGSYAQARGYLQAALEMPDVTPELRQKIEDLLELTDKKLRPDQFSGFAQTGLRYQLGRKFAVDYYPDRGRDDLAIRCARSVRCALHHCAYHRMARRAWSRSADLAEIGIRLAAAISKRHVQRSSVLVPRSVRQRRTVDPILRAAMAGKLKSIVLAALATALAATPIMVK